MKIQTRVFPNNDINLGHEPGIAGLEVTTRFHQSWLYRSFDLEKSPSGYFY